MQNTFVYNNNDKFVKQNNPDTETAVLNTTNIHQNPKIKCCRGTEVEEQQSIHQGINTYKYERPITTK